MRNWIKVVEVGESEEGFIGPEMGKKSPGLSGKFVFRFVNVRWWFVKNAIGRYVRQVLLYYTVCQAFMQAGFNAITFFLIDQLS